MPSALLKGRWLAGHTLVVFMAALFVALGVWQVARHHHKQDLVRADKAAYVAPGPDLSSPPQPSGARAQATGVYDAAHQMLLRDQSRGDALGDDVLTPLRLGDGSAVLVNRGWVRSGAIASAPAVAPPAPGTVIVRGIVREPKTLSSQDTLRQVGAFISVPRVDLTRLGQGLPYTLRPVWIEAQSQQPAPVAGEPALPTPPPPDPVNHLEYAFEWFALALIPIIGWPIALAHFHKKRANVSSVSAAP